MVQVWVGENWGSGPADDLQVVKRLETGNSKIHRRDNFVSKLLQ